MPGRPCHPGLVSPEADQPLLHPLLAARWSPTTFDASYELTAAEIEALLEAARWAPSAGNSQPWAFIVSRRGDATHTRLVRYLARSSGAWAPAASVLVANLAHRYVEDTDWEYSEFSLYDLGQLQPRPTELSGARALAGVPGSRSEAEPGRRLCRLAGPGAVRALIAALHGPACRGLVRPAGCRLDREGVHPVAGRCP